MSYVLLVISLLLVAAAYAEYWKRNSKAALPPGPKGLPIIGNAAELLKWDWLTLADLGEKYGQVSSLSAFGNTYVVLSSTKAANDLLDKRSAYYSDRPRLPMAGELVGWDATMPVIRQGDRFRKMRRNFSQALGPRETREYWKIQERETRKFLQDLLEKPLDFGQLLRHTAGTIILQISHGYTASSGQDELIDLARRVMADFAETTVPGAYLVDLIPWLKWVPSWFPGAKFKRVATKSRRDLLDMVSKAYDFTKNKMNAGEAIQSFTSSLLDQDGTPENEDTVKWTAFSMYAAGSDTTVSALNTFFLAMCLYSEVQATAQAEIDSVLHQERLPTMEDKSSLPYVNAIFKEVLRWGPVVPGVHHRAMREDEYQGYRIPKGSTILVNIRAMLHDPDIYPDPSKFCPERFMAAPHKVEHSTCRDPLQTAFGFGRRACPGRYLAEASAYLSIAMTLAVFTISKARDEFGNVIVPKVDRTMGTVSHVKPFRCDITPRSAHAIELIRQAARGEDAADILGYLHGEGPVTSGLLPRTLRATGGE